MWTWHDSIRKECLSKAGLARLRKASKSAMKEAPIYIATIHTVQTRVNQLDARETIWRCQNTVYRRAFHQDASIWRLIIDRPEMFQENMIFRRRLIPQFSSALYKIYMLLFLILIIYIFHSFILSSFSLIIFTHLVISIWYMYEIWSKQKNNW